MVEKAALGGEDFARYLEKIPGAFLWWAARRRTPTLLPDPQPQILFGRECLELGVITLSGIAQDFLNGQQS
jgi:metal-dependent amidase/aminoacylase/carboxypeptidase family protein